MYITNAHNRFLLYLSNSFHSSLPIASIISYTHLKFITLHYNSFHYLTLSYAKLHSHTPRRDKRAPMSEISKLS